MNIALPVWGEERLAVNTAYADYLQLAGFNPVLVSNHNNPADVVGYCQGLLLPGGVDLEPTFYNEDNLASMSCDPEKDDFERKLFFTFMNAHKKVFGICRGFQLIAREFLRSFEQHQNIDVSFWQHISGHSLANDRSIKRGTPSHSVTIKAKELYGVNKENVRIFVNSMHHQGVISSTNTIQKVDDFNYINITGITKLPNQKNNDVVLVEAADFYINGSVARGVQWHPEELKDVALLRQFFDEAAIEIPIQNVA